MTWFRVGAVLMAVVTTMRVAAAGSGVSAASLVRPGDVVLGNPRGRVTIVDFYDTSCMPCRAMNRRIERMIREDAQIRYVPIDVPILGPQSVLGAKALVAARMQGQFHAMHAELMRQRRLPTRAVLRADAARLGFDVPRFMRDLAGAHAARVVDADLQRAAAMRLRYVPVVYIGRNRIPGAMSFRDLDWLVHHADEQVVTEIVGPPDPS
ncbi:thioredoxin domain-containing protein [Acidiphilium acidophilum]|uniref:DsbA family protein n=1 Tax=Acidiphilium acidophilum TaxID=76588 RepID=UPI002E8E625A|nr:thioredoxin domain-containing protein [Acidiphilium acidophilum]